MGFLEKTECQAILRGCQEVAPSPDGRPGGSPGASSPRVAGKYDFLYTHRLVAWLLRVAWVLGAPLQPTKSGSQDRSLTYASVPTSLHSRGPLPCTNSFFSRRVLENSGSVPDIPTVTIGSTECLQPPPMMAYPSPLLPSQPLRRGL